MPLNDPVPSSAFDVLQRNTKDTDRFVNSESIFKNRTNKNIKPIPLIEAEARAAVLAIGFKFLDPLTFETGATLTSAEQALYWSPANGGNGFYYRWNGAFPSGGKVVPPNSTPLTTGGVSDTAWIIVQNNLSFVQEDRPSGNILIGSRWWKPTKAATALKVALNGNPHWLQEFVVGQAGGSAAAGIKLEDFDSSAGTGGDDTVAFEQACLRSMETGEGIQLLNKTYLIRPRLVSDGNYNFKGFLRGMGDTMIKSFTSPERLPDLTWPRLLPVTAHKVEISGFTLDGNISADPVDEAGWASGYDSFTGARGLVLENCHGPLVFHVTGQNTMWAAIASYGCEHFAILQNTIDYCRGSSGDGIYCWGRNGFIGYNKINDVTRIGIVVETNAGSTFTSRNIQIIGNKMTYGHDASGLYGGVEGNVGIWCENTLNVNTELNEVIDFLEGGIRSVPSFISGTEDSVDNYYRATTLHKNNIIKKTRYGYLVDNIYDGITNVTHIEGGTVTEVNVGVYVGTQAEFVPNNKVVIKDLDVGISVHNIATRAVMQLAGYVEIDGMNVYFDDNFNQELWDSPTDVSGYSTFGAFSNDSGYEFKARNVRCYKVIDGVRTSIGVRTKFESPKTKERLSLILEDMVTSQLTNVVRKFHYIGGEARQLGSDVPTEIGLYERVRVTGRNLVGTSPQIVSVEDSCEYIKFDRCDIEMDSPDEYLYLYNQTKVSVMPLVRLHGCKIKRNFETNGPAIRVNASPELLSEYDDIFNYEMSLCTIENTGGTTSNPIVISDYDAPDGAKLIGYGNIKSASITNNTSGNISTANFNVVAL
jgi:hypothetical protein